MIKGVHLLTPCPNLLISLIDQFRIFFGWMDGQLGTPRCGTRIFCQGGPGPTARIQDPHMGPIHTYVRMYTYIRIYRQAHECSCTGRRMDIHAQGVL